MTEAQKKARKLVSEYYELFGSLKNAKQCAIIAVDEIDRALCSMPLERQYSYLFQLEFWQEVKQEIEKL